MANDLITSYNGKLQLVLEEATKSQTLELMH